MLTSDRYTLTMGFNVQNVPMRLYRRIKVSRKTGCWLWTGSLSTSGYALASWRGKVGLIHRVVYELEVGPIPEGLELDHTCHVTNCVYPGHMEPVTGAVNISRAVFHAVSPAPGGLLLDDLAAVLPEDRAHSDELCARLSKNWPGRYRGWKPLQLGTALADLGVRTRQMWVRGADGRRIANRRGVLREELLAAIEARKAA